MAVRNVRREFNDKVKAMEKAHDISEDDGKRGHAQIQKVTDKIIEEVDRIVQVKEKDVLEV